jgi:hypothetical protein
MFDKKEIDGLLLMYLKETLEHSKKLCDMITENASDEDIERQKWFVEYSIGKYYRRMKEIEK